MIGWLAAAAYGGGFVAHEWGTFTAVAGPDGKAVLWQPLDGSSDLPDFVYGPERLQEGLRQAYGQGKGQSALIRMETPVIYFYTDVERVVNVSVSFPNGQLTEWYPRVLHYTGHGLDWGPVRLLPGRGGPLPHDRSRSHYYPARDVPAATVQVCDERGNERERFLFYRGLGQFPLSVAATAEPTAVRLWTTGSSPGQVLLFERQGDRLGYSLVPADGLAPRPVLDDDLEDVHAQLVAMLVSAGLFRPEALAMVQTWEGDWFEDGLRALYLLPRAETDALLPLTLTPAPDQLVRVLVGRLEVPTPEQRRELAAVLDQPSSNQLALTELEARFGRFAQPWLATSGHSRAPALLALE
jgi:hypothetical protein